MSDSFEWVDPFESFPDEDVNPESRSVFSTPVKAEKPAPVVVKRKREGIQLCKVYDPAKPPKWKSAVYEAKFDGYRCLAHVKDGKAELLTSTGLPHYNVRFIQEHLEVAAAAHGFCDNVVYDGEIIHESLDFDTAGGILRKHEDDPRASGFVFMAWDFIAKNEFDARICTKPLEERKEELEVAIGVIHDANGPIWRVVRVPYFEGAVSEIKEYARQFVIEDGEEGIVAKDKFGLYEYKKSSTWLKWKPEFSGEEIANMKEGDFYITGIKAGRGKHTGRVGAIYISGYLMSDGNISPTQDEPDARMVIGKAGTGFSDAQRIDLQARFDAGTLIGTPVEVHYQELSSKGKVRFPVFYRLREDKF